MTHTVFHYPALTDVSSEAEKLGVFLPLKQDPAALFEPLALGKHKAANRIAFQPMEGTDGTLDGAPGEIESGRDPFDLDLLVAMTEVE